MEACKIYKRGQDALPKGIVLVLCAMMSKEVFEPHILADSSAFVCYRREN